ncbi:MAG: twin-arginine translocase TatA/TatE family subunit, partial [Gammaproteobacteria bacterium]
MSIFGCPKDCLRPIVSAVIKRALLVLMALAVFSAGRLTAGACGGAASAESPAFIDSACKLPDNAREYYARFVKFRPPDDTTVHLNPPRFSWAYVPGLFPQGSDYPAQQRFTFQVSKAEDFANLEINIENTPFNFYNTIAGGWEWIVILVVALLIFGKRLP